MKLTGNTIFITGGTSGIGLATARLFLQQGAVVTVSGRKPERLAASEKEGLNAVLVDSVDRGALDVFFAGHGPMNHLVIALGGSKGR